MLNSDSWGGIGEGDINKLINALKNGGLVDLGDDDTDDDGVSDDNHDEDNNFPAERSSAAESGEEVDDEIFKEIDNSSKLDADKKEELLVQAQNDQALAKANIDREEQRKADMLAALEEEARRKQNQVEAQESDSENKEAELQDLKRTQEESRQEKLRALERQEYTASLEAGDSPHDVRVSTIATNRYIAIMRCIAADARVSFYELGVEFAAKRAKASLECAKRSVESSKSATAGLGTDSTVTHGALVTIYDVNEAQQAISAEEAMATEELMKRLNAQLEKALLEEDNNKAEWMRDLSIVNPGEEVIKLRTKCLEEFKTLQARRESCRKKHIQAAQNEFDAQMAILHVKAKAEGFNDERTKFLEDAFALEEDSRIEAAKLSSADLGRILEAEEYTLGHILNLADSWGPGVNRAALQRDLFERVKYDIGVEHDIRARISLCEQEIRNDMTQN